MILRSLKKIPFLLFSLSLAVIVQGQIRLEGTTWTRTDATEVGTAVCFFTFSTGGKVSSQCIVNGNFSMAGANIDNPLFNPMGSQNPYGAAIQNTPLPQPPSYQGTYTIKANSVRMEFDTDIVVGTIQGDKFTCEYISKGSNRLRSTGWVFTRSTGIAAATATSQPVTTASSSVPKPLSENIINKYNPRALTTNVIGDQFNTQGYFKSNYYTFWSGGGDVTITTDLQSFAQRYDSATIQIGVYDENEFPMGSDLLYVGNQQSGRKVTRIKLEARKQYLLLVKLYSGGAGPARYSMKFDGPIEFRPPAVVNADSNSSVPTVEERIKQLENLWDRAELLFTRKQFRDAIPIYTQIIGLAAPLKVFLESRQVEPKKPEKTPSDVDPATALTTASNPETVQVTNYLIGSYNRRAFSKNELGDTKGACEDIRIVNPSVIVPMCKSY